MKRYEESATNRGLQFTLTIGDCNRLMKQTCCEYCNDTLSPGLHLDRVDNTHGYHIQNVVRCCETCNFMKRALTRDVFIGQSKKIARKARAIEDERIEGIAKEMLRGLQG